MADDGRLSTLLAEARSSGGRIVVLTGAGISAESGIPTFRGREGYWRVGSVNHRPEHLATRAAFHAMPREIWGWYLYRRRICRAAQPNAAHQALVALEVALADRFLLVTQNVDGLHRRAGNTPARTFEIHGNLELARCIRECGAARPLPAGLGDELDTGAVPDDPTLLAALHCTTCGDWLRPHVLWFDESYDEEHFRYLSSLEAIDTAALLAVIGTSGATTLPAQMVQRAVARGLPLVVINAEPSPFGDLARGSPRGDFIHGRASEHVPRLVAQLVG